MFKTANRLLVVGVLVEEAIHGVPITAFAGYCASSIAASVVIVLLANRADLNRADLNRIYVPG
jgi:uncharacterized membrane protein